MPDRDKTILWMRRAIQASINIPAIAMHDLTLAGIGIIHTGGSIQDIRECWAGMGYSTDQIPGLQAFT